MHAHVQYKENLEAHMKHADDPQKFMGSEVDLDEEVQRLFAIAGSPELYPELGTVPSILALLGHKNSDIAATAINLLRELADTDAIEDSVRSFCQLAFLPAHSVLAGLRYFAHTLKSSS